MLPVIVCPEFTSTTPCPFFLFHPEHPPDSAHRACSCRWTLLSVHPFPTNFHSDWLFLSSKPPRDVSDIPYHGQLSPLLHHHTLHPPKALVYRCNWASSPDAPRFSNDSFICFSWCKLSCAFPFYPIYHQVHHVLYLSLPHLLPVNTFMQLSGTRPRAYRCSAFTSLSSHSFIVAPPDIPFVAFVLLPHFLFSLPSHPYSYFFLCTFSFQITIMSVVLTQ